MVFHFFCLFLFLFLLPFTVNLELGSRKTLWCNKHLFFLVIPDSFSVIISSFLILQLNYFFYWLCYYAWTMYHFMLFKTEFRWLRLRKESMALRKWASEATYINALVKERDSFSSAWVDVFVRNWVFFSLSWPCKRVVERTLNFHHENQ